MRTKLLATIFLVLNAAPAHALNSASAFATLNWAGFTFTTTGSVNVMNITVIDQHGDSFTSMTPTTAFGTASASASSVNGFVTAAAAATTLGFGGDVNVGRAIGIAQDFLVLFGTGTGTVVVSVPYHIGVNIDEPDPSFDKAFASATIGISDLLSVPTLTTLVLDATGSVTRDGVLTVATPYPAPIGAPFTFGFRIFADVTATSAVPEVPTMLLVAFGLVLAMLVLRARRRGPLVSRIKARLDFVLTARKGRLELL